MKPGVRISLGILFVTIVVGEIATLEVEKAKLRREIGALRPSESGVQQARADIAADHLLLARLRAGDDESRRAIHADLAQARAELAALEAHAQQRALRADTEAQSAAWSLATNRDPQLAPTKPEWFVDAGRGTPAAAFQTLVWAAMKGKERELAAGVALEGAARNDARDLLARLPPGARERYRTPEEVAALFFADMVTETTALQISDTAFADPGHATLTVRVQANGRERETKFPMVLSSDGWQIAVAEQQIERMRHRIVGQFPTP